MAPTIYFHPLMALVNQNLIWSFPPYMVKSFYCDFKFLNETIISGAGIFITTIVVSVILFTKSFTIRRRPITRDILFYIAAVVLVWYFIFQGTLRLYNSLSKYFALCLCLLFSNIFNFSFDWFLCNLHHNRCSWSILLFETFQ